jgi:hypothetical protein
MQITMRFQLSMLNIYQQKKKNQKINKMHIIMDVN